MRMPGKGQGMARIRFIQDFLATERAEGKAAATLRNRRRNLEKFDKWLQSQEGKDDQTLTNADLVAFVNELRERYAADEVNTNISALRLYFRWMEEMELREDEQNPARRLKFLPVHPKPVEAMTPDDVRKLLVWVNKAKKERFGVYRSAVLSLLLLDTGLRIGEALGLKLDDVNMIEGRILVKAKKTKSLRVVPISAAMQGQLRRFLTHRKLHFEKHNLQDEGWLFPAEHGRALLRDTAEASMRQTAKDADVPLLRPHKCRHTFARLSLMNGMPMPALMRIGGWKKLQTVARYATLNDEQCAQAHAISSPLAGSRRQT